MPLISTIAQFAKHPEHLPKNIIWRFPKTKSIQRHIFIVGAPRSGTTLVKLILGVHPNLCSPGYETGIFLYQDIFSKTFKELTQSQLELIQSESRDIVDFFDKFAQINLTKIGGNRFVEKTPSHVLHLSFLRKNFPNSQFINIFRDGRDAYCSARHHRYVVQGKNLKTYAKYWVKCVESRLKEGNLATNILDVKYEELVKNSEAEIKEIMNFLGDKYDPKQLEPYQYSQSRIFQSKRQEFAKLSQPIDSRSIGRYQKELTPGEIKQFNYVAGDTLKLLGYSL